jgi:PleD family two-component response regulator
MTARILIADEDIDTRIIVRAILERQQFAVLEADDPDSALAIARDNELALIILNYPMKNADGETLVRRLRSQSGTQDVRILNLTSRVVPPLLEEAAREGVDCSVAKPIDVVVLVDVVRQMISHQ